METIQDHVLTGPMLTRNELRGEPHGSLQGWAGCLFLRQRRHEEELESISFMGRMHWWKRKSHKMSRPQIGPQSLKPKLPESFRCRTARKQSDGITGEDSSLGLLIGASAHPRLLSLTGCVNLDEIFPFHLVSLFSWLKKLKTIILTTSQKLYIFVALYF